MEEQLIHIPEFILKWTDWFPWERFLLDARYDNRSVNPPKEPGVYEVRIFDQDERLTIGKASNLRQRVKQGLVKGTIPHSSGEKIRANEDVTQIVIRWAETERPSCVEEELHKKYFAKYSMLPKYTDHT